MRRSPRLAIASATVAAGSCHLEIDAACLAGGVAHEVDLALQLGLGVLARTTGTGVRLGDEPAEAQRHRDAVCGACRWPRSYSGELSDTQRVLVGLGRQAGESTASSRDQPLLERRVDGAVEVLFGDQLVDHLAQHRHEPASERTSARCDDRLLTSPPGRR